MSLKSLVLALSLTATLASGASAAPLVLNGIQMQINPNVWQHVSLLPAGIRGKGCTFYENANGGGESWHKEVGWLAQAYTNQDSYAQYVTTVGPWWNDKISSIQCDESDNVHCVVAVYRDDNKGGGDEGVFAGIQGLVNMSSYGWDDAISSYMIFCTLMK